jgi:hypothetical protein
MGSHGNGPGGTVAAASRAGLNHRPERVSGWFGPLANGGPTRIYDLVTSANIACCGGHASVRLPPRCNADIGPGPGRRCRGASFMPISRVMGPVPDEECGDAASIPAAAIARAVAVSSRCLREHSDFRGSIEAEASHCQLAGPVHSEISPTGPPANQTTCSTQAGP